MYQVDAFTTALFKGNPAAVLLLDEWLDETLMQNIALENNLAETAFVKVLDAENYEIRWFSPTTEIEFCGHATLASACVLFKNDPKIQTIHFHVKSLGTFIVTQENDGKIIMNFPILKAHKLEKYPEILNRALTKPFKNVYLNEQAYIIEYHTEQDVYDEVPNLELLNQLGEQTRDESVHGVAIDVAITARAEKYDCVSRYFAPANGIPEDFVTGSIHTGIVPMWAEQLNKKEISAYQASTRGGELFCKILDAHRMEISGYGKLYMEAELFI